MTVGENVAYPLTVRRLPQGRGRRSASSAALDMVQARTTWRERRPAQLSGGQQQRVALARALVFEPEARADGRAAGRARQAACASTCSSRSSTLHDSSASTVVYVTHDQSEALTMSDRVAVFNDGRVQQVDTADRALRAARERVRRQLHRREQPAERHGSRDRGRTRRGSGSRGGARGAWRFPSMSAGVGAATTLSIRPERISLGAIEDEARQPAGGARAGA